MLELNKKLGGIWIDHTKALIVHYDKSGETAETVESLVEPRVKGTGGSGTTRVAHHKIEGHRREDSHIFYDKVISKIGDLDEFLLMGPSSARTELSKFIDKRKDLSSKLRDSFAVDHMSERQIAARVREYFHLGN